MPEFLTTVVVSVPGLKIRSEANLREHWAVKRRRVKEQQDATHVALCSLGRGVRKVLRDAPGLAVRFVRIGGRKMDSDNLTGGFKAVRDALAAWVGVDDGSDWWDWLRPAQESGECGIRIELTVTGGV